MKKRLISAALKIIPQRLQLKALVKGWKFVFGQRVVDAGSHVKLTLEDFNVTWQIPVIEDASALSEEHMVSVSVTLDRLFECRRKSMLIASIDDGSIHIDGEVGKVQALRKAVESISQPQLDRLVSRCCSFLHIKPEPRIDLATVSVTDIECDEDIDFIRDSAINMQKADTEQALRLMLVAQQARPTGSYINKKVKEYQAQLN